MSKINEFLMEAVDDICETIPTEVSIHDEYTGTREIEITDLSRVDLEDVVDFAIKAYIGKLGDIQHQELLEESKLYLRELIIEQLMY